MNNDPGQEKTAAIAGTPLRLPSAESAMEGVVGRALGFGAEKMGSATFEGALAVLQQGPENSAARGYLHYSLGVQVAEALGALDENLKSVSMFEYDATTEDITLAENDQPTPIHLIVWTERRTEALQALTAGFDRALLKDYARLIDPRRRTQLLDVHFITDNDVVRRIGVAALVSSLYNPALKIWER